MTQINSVNAAQTQAAALGAQEETDELSASTKKQLEALGITVTDGMTESEAQQKIQQARLERQAQEGAQMPSETELMADIKTLAGQIGVVYSDSDDTEAILASIGEELEAQIDESENNPQELSTLMGYFNQLRTLDTTYDEIQSVQDKIYAAMDLVSQGRKQALGLE